ncbi:hypothetical protein [Salininema proteolyticum]|uniref:Uncharacterized protein n=1 Tax=Salininema proteolyticum TaxID=1607685 RepID=A0ABV8TYK0_9ACTN
MNDQPLNRESPAMRALDDRPVLPLIRGLLIAVVATIIAVVTTIVLLSDDEPPAGHGPELDTQFDILAVDGSECPSQENVAGQLPQQFLNPGDLAADYDDEFSDEYELLREEDLSEFFAMGHKKLTCRYGGLGGTRMAGVAVIDYVWLPNPAHSLDDVSGLRGPLLGSAEPVEADAHFSENWEDSEVTVDTESGSDAGTVTVTAAGIAGNLFIAVEATGQGDQTEALLSSVPYLAVNLYDNAPYA